MTEEIPSIKLLFSDEFKDRLRTLAKRYRSIRTDLQPLIDDLQIGKFIGDQIPGIGYTVFKVRLKNSDIQKGKRLFWFLCGGKKNRDNFIEI
jgi:mRNA-degrading endonuclease RelE of RelBE toxin-antitoxin system